MRVVSAADAVYPVQAVTAFLTVAKSGTYVSVADHFPAQDLVSTVSCPLGTAARLSRHVLISDRLEMHAVHVLLSIIEQT